MLLTTALFAIAIHSHFKLPIIVGLLFLLFYLVEVPYWVSNIQKFVEGAWVTCMITVLITVPLSAWYFGEAALKRSIRALVETRPLTAVAAALASSSATASPAESLPSASPGASPAESLPSSASPAASTAEQSETESGTPSLLDKLLVKAKQNRLPGAACFFVLSKKTPPVFEVFLRHTHLLPKLLLFVQVKTLPSARIPSSSRLQIVDLGHNTYYVKVRYGFAQPHKNLHRDLQKAVKKQKLPEFDPDEMTYILSKEVVKFGKPRWYQYAWRWLFKIYAFMKRVYQTHPNCKLPKENEVSYGFAAEI